MSTPYITGNSVTETELSDHFVGYMHVAFLFPQNTQIRI